jgi:hypothetical protein
MFSCGDGLHMSRNSGPGTIEADVILIEDDSKRDSKMTRRAQQREYIHDGRYGPIQSITMEGRIEKTGLC